VIHGTHQQRAEIAKVTGDQEGRDLSRTILQESEATPDSRMDEMDVGWLASLGNDVLSGCKPDNPAGQVCNSLPLGIGEDHDLPQFAEQHLALEVVVGNFGHSFQSLWPRVTAPHDF
jgi:hypothetical protein